MVKLPEDEDTPEKRVAKIFGNLDKVIGLDFCVQDLTRGRTTTVV